MFSSGQSTRCWSAKGSAGNGARDLLVQWKKAPREDLNIQRLWWATHAFHEMVGYLSKTGRESPHQRLVLYYTRTFAFHDMPFSRVFEEIDHENERKRPISTIQYIWFPPWCPIAKQKTQTMNTCFTRQPNWRSWPPHCREEERPRKWASRPPPALVSRPAR